MNWRPHERLQRRWVSDCGHYERSVTRGIAGDVYDAWFHIGQLDFEHVGFSRDPEQLDRLVQFHAERKHLTGPPATSER